MAEQNAVDNSDSGKKLLQVLNIFRTIIKALHNTLNQHFDNKIYINCLANV